MKRKNCWEIKKCGREIRGEKAEELGVCPAASPNKFDGINKGTFAGRFCWTISGTLCNEQRQGTYAEKLRRCINCEVQKQVHEDEGRYFILVPPKDDDESDNEG